MIKTRKSVVTVKSGTHLINDEGFTLGTDNLTLLQTFPGSPQDPSRAQWMKLAETSPGLDFWNDPEEDVYTETDGEPI